jgi:hypothetical protein
MVLRRVLVVIAVCAVIVLGVATASDADSGHRSTCSGGPIAPGDYHSLAVTGSCALGPGKVVIKGGLTIAPGAGLDATNCDAQVRVSGGI